MREKNVEAIKAKGEVQKEDLEPYECELYERMKRKEGAKSA